MRPALSTSLPLLTFALVIVLGAPSSALAQEAGTATAPAPQLPPAEASEPGPAQAAQTVVVPVTGTGAPTTTVQSAPGSGGLTVIAPLAGGGSVTAVGCSAVTVSGHSTEVRPGGAVNQPCPVAVPEPIEARPRYARDGGRKAALITAPIVYGLGMMVSGVNYLSHEGSCRYGSSRCDSRRTALWSYGVISAAVPSIPRWVVGDTVGALVYTGARGGSIAAAALIPWDDATGPFLLGFAAPVALAIVDMATTPHREDLNRSSDKFDKPADPAPARAGQDGARITSVSPIALGDRENKSRGAGVALGGTF